MKYICMSCSNTINIKSKNVTFEGIAYCPICKKECHVEPASSFIDNIGKN